MTTVPPGQIVILNGAPRSGKSSIASAIQASFDGPWMNLGVDAHMQITPPRYRHQKAMDSKRKAAVL